METLAYLLQPTFEAWASAASHHELTLRREKKIPSTTSGGEDKKKAVVAEWSGTAVGSTELQKLLEESLAKHMVEVKQEIVGQKQTLARMQIDRTRGARPPQPCFTCGGPHFKKNCPEELAKRGAINQVTMAELLDMDMSAIAEEDELQEMTQRFQAFIAAEVEITPAVARQVTFVDLSEDNVY